MSRYGYTIDLSQRSSTFALLQGLQGEKKPRVDQLTADAAGAPFIGAMTPTLAVKGD